MISLTALTGGVAPAFAKPGDDPADPGTTVIVPTPVVVPTEQEQPTKPAPVAAVPVAPSVVAPSVVAPPVVEAPVVVPPVEEASTPTRATQPAPVVEAPSPVRPPEPAPSAATPSAATPSVPSVAPSPRREVPSSPSTRASVDATTPSPPAQIPSRQAPSAQTSASQAPSSQAPASDVPPAVAPSPAAGASPTPSGVTPPPSPALVAPTPTSDDPSASSASPATTAGEAATPSSRGSSGSSKPSDTDASSNPAAERVIEKVEPQTLAAPDEDVQIAKSAKIVEEKPLAAPKKDIDDISNLVDLRDQDRDRPDRDRPDQNGRRDDDRVRLASDRNWDRNVRQWRPDWVQYDEYYRPVICNPYRDPVRIVYIYQNAPRIVWIPPLARIVLEVAQYAAYSFTAVVANTINQAANVAVGSFFGGGYNPGFGLPLPPPPPPLLNFANVPVQVRYSDATYEPFRVQKIVDVGDDPRYGERKVLLDGVTPAWGQWTQTASGERSFEVHKTQQFPGLDDPQEAPLPGDYQLRLASDESSAGNKRDVYLIAVALACGVLSIGAVVLSVMMGRRRRPLH